MSQSSGRKYLNYSEIKSIIGDIQFDDSFVPMSQDTYNEEAVLTTIQVTGKVMELSMAAINMACVGYGNKKFGVFKHNNLLIDIAELMTACNVKIGLTKDAKISEKDLTPQRLCRAFRYQIREFIIARKFETYLYRKYSTREQKYAHICFRGAEYLDDLKKEECDYLLLLYAKLDADRNTNISERIRRVLQAKGLVARTFMV